MQTEIITPPPPPPPTITIQKYNMPTIVYRASFIVRRRTSCTNNRRELMYAYNNQPSASYHPLSLFHWWHWRHRHIDNNNTTTGIRSSTHHCHWQGEVKCIIPPLRNHSTITKINANTQQSTEPHIPIAAPPPLWCHRHRDDDKHNNMPTICCIRKHRGGEYICEPCSTYHIMQWGGWYLQQPNRLAIEHTTINLYLVVGDRSAYWGGGINVSAMHSITSQLHDNTIHTPPPYESLLITTIAYLMFWMIVLLFYRYQTNKVI